MSKIGNIRNLLNGKRLFLIMIILLFVSIFIEKKSKNRLYTREDTVRIQKILNDNETLIDNVLSTALKQIDSLSIKKFIEDYSVQYSSLLSDKEMGIFIYSNDSLIFWSDNNISVPRSFNQFPEGNVVKLFNSFYVKREKINRHTKVIGLILLKKEYPYENRFIKSGFREEFSLSKDIRLILDGSNTGNQAIFSKEGKFLFSLDYSITRKWNKIERNISVSLYCIVFTIFLLLIRKYSRDLISKYNGYMILGLFFVLALTYILLHYYRLPDIIFNQGLFLPDKYARPGLFPSMGDIFLFSVLALLGVYIFKMDVEIKYHSSGWLRFLILLFSGIIILIWSRFTFSLFKSLILDSTISFRVFKVLELSAYTFIGFLVLAFLSITLIMILDIVLSWLKRNHRKNDALIFIILLNANAFALLIPTTNSVTRESAFLLRAISFQTFYFNFKPGFKYKLSSYLPFVLLFSFFTVFEVVKFSERKAMEDMKIKAVNLSAEHDPVAELLFVDVNKRMNNDIELSNLIFSERLDEGLIVATLQRKYFSGFWDKYDLQVTLCGPPPYDSVLVSPENKLYNCYEYFYQNIVKDTIPVPNTKFYYLDNMNGRISYFSIRTFEKGTRQFTLFIELDSRLISEGLGYPELLLEEKVTTPIAATEYSYSKYNKGRLITFSGNFPYYMTSIFYTDGKEGFSFLKKDNYDHLIYNMDKDNTIIVSKPAIYWMDVIISFSYIFVFSFITILVLMVLINKSPLVLSGFHWNFKNKIQIAVTSLLFFSLLFIGAGTVYFSLKQYRKKHIEILQEKMQSVYVAMIHKLEFEQNLHNWYSKEFYSMDGLLKNLSNVFYTDINLYDSNGELIATSRPEIFENGLIATHMNTSAYREMVIHQRLEYIANERIGDLSYMSSYVPFVNSENKLLAYLNLPYFTQQDELTREITNLVVAIINILVLLSLLSFTIAVFMSNTLTQPLRLIQEKFEMISLRGKNEKIDYKVQDEIGSLVQAYNEMVDQLSKSVEMISKSERELAWREMAKQIAHEIKNPLTPMRLSIQHLQRTWNDKSENWDQQLEKLSKTLIEQIDNLSAIATEFSNFAKMPQPNNEKLNLVTQLISTIRLFDNTENANIKLNLNGLTEVYIFADTEQLSSVFINLIKNAIQAAPEGGQIEVQISLYTTSEKATVKIKDNGKGIPEEIRDKLFQPNFTTKTSGMGMGLAIVKNIIQNTGGNISYKTELNKGTIFTVEFPVYKEEIEGK